METTEKVVKPEEWETMSFDQLMTQKNIMLERYEFLSAKGYTDIARTLWDGIQRLDSILFK